MQIWVQNLSAVLCVLRFFFLHPVFQEDLQYKGFLALSGKFRLRRCLKKLLCLDFPEAFLKNRAFLASRKQNLGNMPVLFQYLSFFRRIRQLKAIFLILPGSRSSLFLLLFCQNCLRRIIFLPLKVKGILFFSVKICLLHPMMKGYRLKLQRKMQGILIFLLENSIILHPIHCSMRQFLFLFRRL